MATSFVICVTTTLLSYWLMRSFVISMQAYKYEQLRRKRQQMTLIELREDLNRQYYGQIMREIYFRIDEQKK